MKRKPTKEHMSERATKYQDVMGNLIDHIQKIQDTIIILRTEQEINQEIMDFNELVIQLNLYVNPSKSTNLFGLITMFKTSFGVEPGKTTEDKARFYWGLDDITKVEQALATLVLEMPSYLNKQFYINSYHF